MKHQLYKRMLTADGHEAVIHLKRNALLFFRFQYIVSIMSRVLAPTSAGGLRREVIYGWEDHDITRVNKEVAAWTVSDIFKRNDYLRDMIAKQIASGSP